MVGHLLQFSNKAGVLFHVKASNVMDADLFCIWKNIKQFSSSLEYY